MVLLETNAIVLHAFDYLETSRIIRLATRDAGVQSVIARGARRSSRRFGSALDLFATGVASIHLKQGRDLQQLVEFDIVSPRRGIALDLDRFASASMLAELATRFVENPDQTEQFDALAAALDHLDGAEGVSARIAGIAAAWQLVSAQGFAPAIDECAGCQDPVDAGADLWFSHTAGGILCDRCHGSAGLGRGAAGGARSGGGRRVPGAARRTLRDWLGGTTSVVLDPSAARAHTRLLHEFLVCHLTDAVQLRAFSSWMKRFHADAVAP